MKRFEKQSTDSGCKRRCQDNQTHSLRNTEPRSGASQIICGQPEMLCELDQQHGPYVVMPLETFHADSVKIHEISNNFELVRLQRQNSHDAECRYAQAKVWARRDKFAYSRDPGQP